MSHYHDYYELDAWDRIASYSQNQQQSDLLLEEQYHNLKDSKNKPSNARNCFIEHICLIGVDNDYTSKLGYLLSDLFELVESKTNLNEVGSVIKQISDHILTESSDSEAIINDLIKVRAYALESGKYAKDGYKEQIDPILLTDATARHFIKFVLKNPVDSESKCLHLSHILANLILIAYQIEQYGDKK